MNICMEKEYSLSKKKSIILKRTVGARVCVCMRARDIDFARNQQFNIRGRIMNNKIPYDPILIFF